MPEERSRGALRLPLLGLRLRDPLEWERGDVRRRTIKKVARLYDVSPVTFPAYQDTSVALRSLAQLEEQDEQTQKFHEYEEEQAHLVRALILKQKSFIQ